MHKKAFTINSSFRGRKPEESHGIKTKRFFAPFHSALNDGKVAFTLAEVLITLTIIGVIAALTIPNLMQKWSDHADVQKVKEAYSILNNAIKLAISENGPTTEWDWPDKQNDTDSLTSKNANYIVDALKPYLKFQKICYSENGCISKKGGLCKNLDGSDCDSWGGALEVGHGKAILNNGMTVIFAKNRFSQNLTKQFWDIRVDINGQKGPNRYGYDLFEFFYNQGKLIAQSYGPDDCNRNGSQALEGRSCSYWVLKHGNMDYKYRDVSKEW